MSKPACAFIDMDIYNAFDVFAYTLELNLLPFQ